ncbi:pseudouridine-5'-phosphate glycosidase [Endozoicomonas sp. 4G]|uniref:pseudouridine-5'-phosphate glycosidase n=1 Tax=Endozoicomonas sp. 4G TaxID=2872754 RepID=UPI002079158F|nr:pseudouridine-5'-phosphate glycosidase [Endozoicomonas sp. 4G]
MNNFLDIHPDVSSALTSGTPVVALESVVISHGLPFPQNLEIALELEKILLDQGVQPATTAIINGRLKAGLSKKELEFIASENKSLHKASRRDLAGLISHQRSAGTTVAATVVIAAMIGIPIMTTGGIGGVHKHVEKTLDISADLIELARTPVAVVCGGPKAILDLPKTLEFLETRGVPVVGYQTDKLPAYYSHESNLSVDFRVDSPEQTAHLIECQLALPACGGLLICNPLPKADALPWEEIAPKIDDAVFHAEKQGIHGKALTPFLLQHLFQDHGEQLLQANLSMLRHNAQLAAMIARHFNNPL